MLSFGLMYGIVCEYPATTIDTCFSVPGFGRYWLNGSADKLPEPNESKFHSSVTR